MPQTSPEFTRSEAENAVRMLNLYYNRTISYSFDHPTVQEFVPKVYAAFQPLWATQGVSLLFQEFGYFIGTVDIVYQPNNRRIAEHLKRFGIEAISFSTPPSLPEFTAFLDACSLTHAGAEAFMKYLLQRRVTSLSINDVSLRTVKEGDFVSSAPPHAGSPSRLPQSGPTDPFAEMAMRAVMGKFTNAEMGANLSLLQLLENPTALPQAMLEQSSQAGEQQPQVLQQSLARVLGMFQESAESADVPVEDLLLGMHNMRGELLKALKAQQNLTQNVAGSADAVDSADDMFAQTSAKLILTEYQKSQGNFKKTARIIQRIIPDRANLQRILPLLREHFLRAGIPLLEYYHMLEELNILLGSDEAYQGLLRASEGMGIDQEEILSELRKDPAQAAKLLVLASEVKRMSGDQSGESLITALVNYVESAGDAMTSTPATTDEVGLLTGMLRQMENSLNAELEGRTVSPQVKKAGRQKMHLRFQQTIAGMKGRAVTHQMLNPGASEEEKVASLLEIFSDASELDQVEESVLSSVLNEGMAEDLARQILTKARQQLDAKRHRNLSRDLPTGVYVKNVLDFYLKMEISRARRYHVPFTVILISFEGLPEGGTPGVELTGLQNVLIGDIRKYLRETDLIGYLAFNRFLIVLPMTTQEQAERVTHKLLDAPANHVALPDGSHASIKPRLGMAAYQNQSVDDYPKMMAAVKANWQNFQPDSERK